MRSQYHTVPYIGYDTFDTHFEYVTAKRHNIFKPEQMIYDYTQFKIDRMRLSQVRFIKNHINELFFSLLHFWGAMFAAMLIVRLGFANITPQKCNNEKNKPL